MKNGPHATPRSDSSARKAFHQSASPVLRGFRIDCQRNGRCSCCLIFFLQEESFSMREMSKTEMSHSHWRNLERGWFKRAGKMHYRQRVSFWCNKSVCFPHKSGTRISEKNEESSLKTWIFLFIYFFEVSCLWWGSDTQHRQMCFHLPIRHFNYPEKPKTISNEGRKEIASQFKFSHFHHPFLMRYSKMCIKEAMMETRPMSLHCTWLTLAERHLLWIGNIYIS